MDHYRIGKMKTSKSDVEKMRIYMGHDVLIESLMVSLGQTLERTPQFASSLIFELYRNGSNSYFIKIKYNGVAMKLDGDCKGMELCEYAQFR